MQFVTRRLFSKAFRNTQVIKRPSMLFRQDMRFFAAQTVQCPSMGDSITEGTVQEYSAAEGQFVNRDDVVAVVETDKVMVDIRAPQDGVITKFHVAEGDTIEVGSDFFSLDSEAKGSAATPVSETKAEVSTPAAKEEASIPTPVQPPTPVREEVKSTPPASTPAKKAPSSSAPPPPGIQSGNSGLSTITGSRTETRVKMSRMRKTISKRLKEAQDTNAMLTTFNEVDMSQFMGLRKEFQEGFQKKHGVKLGFMGAFVRGVVQASKEQPIVNALIEGDEIVYRDYVDISVAVATPKGLVVPVLRNCETMGYADVERSLLELSLKARDGKLGMDDMKGGTFTITNGGVFGSMMGTPIINPPQSAILGMHAIKNRPVVVGDKIVARPIMYLALTYDHRLIDGREAVLFLRKIKECVEDPHNVLFDL